MSSPATFGYTRATSLDEALRILATDDGVKLLAGGQSLIPVLKLRLGHAETLLDIGRLPELRGISKLDDGRLSVGALTTYAELIDSPAIHYGVLRDALPSIGDVQVRNLGTVGGAVAHGDPASDLPAALLALGAELVLQSSSGTRTLPIDGFFQGAFVTAARHDEILTRILLPAPSDNAGSAYESLEQPASGYSIVGVAAVLVVGAGGIVEYAGVGITGVSDHPYRASEVEAALLGTTASPEVVAAAAAMAVGTLPVNGDIHANTEYRAAMATVYTRRAITAALARLG